MTVAEVASILKLNQQTIRNWVDAGKLPAVRLGRRVRIKRSDFDVLVQAGSSGDASATRPPSTGIWEGEVQAPADP